MSEMYKLTYKPEDVSDKDYNFKSLTKKISPVSTEDEYILPEGCPIFDQLTLGSCVANSTAAALSCLLEIQSNKSHQEFLQDANPFSRLFIYWNARRYSNSTDKDEGSMIRDAYSSLSEIGCCREQDFPYNVDKVFDQPDLTAYQEATDNKIKAFYRIVTGCKLTAEDVEYAIRSNHPVSAAFGIGQEFQNTYKNDNALNPPSVIKGYHALLIQGVRKKQGKTEFLIRNSWSKNWGNNGYCWFSSNYINDYTSCDFWVPTHIDPLIF